VEHLDVVIVGAGLSGIGAAWHLQNRCPSKHYAILEARQAIGGTWDLFRYPGIRSDSDMFTLGYNFRPWMGDKSIADGASIRDYVTDTARENGIDQHIRFGHRLISADWSSGDAHWVITAKRGDEIVTLTAGYVIMCSGYYRYDAGHLPDFPAIETFAGRVVHPQFWPDELDYADKKVVVVGSGATAMTLVPAMAESAGHVTMLQRSPTYVASVPGTDPVARRLRAILPTKLAYRAVRLKNVLYSMAMFALMRRNPEPAKARLVGMVRDALGPDYDVGKHFTPRYNPWDQRLCAVPDSDLFDAIKSGKVSVVTDTIDRFEAGGIRLTSGETIDADIVVTATGLQMQLLGGAELLVDGTPVVMPDTMIYKGMMLGNVPNLSYVIGYNNASWTLKADLTCEHTCRIINYMDRRHFVEVTPKLDPAQMTDGNFFGLTSGYLERALGTVPRQGARHPWKVHHNYARDYASLKLGKVDDGVLQFRRAGVAAKAA
jgi:cation diffusion facilitator CzcD-associated flavoprotein CzcO